MKLLNIKIMDGNKIYIGKDYKYKNYNYYGGLKSNRAKKRRNDKAMCKIPLNSK